MGLEHMPPDERRMGEFSIAHRLIHEEPESVRRILRDCIVVRAESSFATDSIEYTGFHPAFAITRPGDVLPRYTAAITKVVVGDIWTYNVEWRMKG